MTTLIHLPDAPQIDGLIFRPARGVEDAQALYLIHQGRLVRDGIDPLSTLESLPAMEDICSSLSAAAEQNCLDDYILAQVGGQVAGYNRVVHWQENDKTWVYLVFGWVLPEWRGKGLGTALLGWSERHARRQAAEQHPTERCELAGNATSTEVEATELLRQAGYWVAYNMVDMEFHPAAPLPLHPLPGGLELRLPEPEQYLQLATSIFDCYKDEYDDGRFDETNGPQDNMPLLQDPRNEPGRDAGLWQVAWGGEKNAALGDQIAGQVLAWLNRRGLAEIWEVSVRPAWRRRGLGRALLERCLHALQARGVETIRLHTNANFRTRAIDLYRSLGFQVVKEFPRYRKDF